jgi:hypothetical protein
MLPTTTVTDWSARVDAGQALDEGALASLVTESLDASLGMLFTATPREELDEIGRYARLQDEAWCGQVRSIVAAYNRASDAQREFAADEIALALGISPLSGSRVLGEALDVAGLPGLLESVENNVLTRRHALAIVRELSLVELTVEQRHAVTLLTLARYTGQTPGQLAQLVKRLILQVDLAAAQARRDVATGRRYVAAYGDVDGQASLSARGPAEQIAAIKARLAAELDAQIVDPADDRTRAQREYDLFVELLTTGTVGDQQLLDYSVAVIVPFSTAAGGDLELGDIPGYGPILPSTARELLEQTEVLTQVAVDANGCVVAVIDVLIDVLGDRVTAAREAYQDTRAFDGVLGRLATAPTLTDLSTDAYRTPTRLRRVLQHRDRTCVFPGCTRLASQADIDHRTPWPAGRTSTENCQCLCRRHHRAKQAVFTVLADTDGIWWITRGGWRFLRRPQGYGPAPRSVARPADNPVEAPPTRKTTRPPGLRHARRVIRQR